MLGALIASAAGMAYDAFVAGPERRRVASDARKKAQEQYEYWLKEYEKLVAEDPLASEDVTRAYDLAKKQVQKEVSEARPVILQDLANRGVRSSGVGQESLDKLDQQATDSLATAQSNIAIDAIRRNDQKKQALISAMMGQTMPAYQSALQYEQMQPLVDQQNMAGYFGNLGSLFGTEYLLDKLGKDGSGTPTATTSPFQIGSKLSLTGGTSYDPFTIDWLGYKAPTKISIGGSKGAFTL